MAAVEMAQALPPGTGIAGRWRIERLIGAGGFGLTYEASEFSRNGAPVRVALKEYMPRGMCARDISTGSITVLPGEHAAHFRGGLASFKKEANALARLDHPSIVRVRGLGEANGTAYMALEFVEGVTLGQWLEGLGHKPSQVDLDRLLRPILDALIQVHSTQTLHRDLKPDNIMLRADGTPVLIDFGAVKALTRSETDERTATLNFLTEGYAAPEQHVQGGEALLGPWTDIYAVGAMVYRMLTGRLPPNADFRGIDDTYVPLTSLPRHVLSSNWRPEFLAAIDKALRLKRADRHQSVVEFRSALGFSELPRSTRVTGNRMTGGEGVQSKGDRLKWPYYVAGTVVALVIALLTSGYPDERWRNLARVEESIGHNLPIRVVQAAPDGQVFATGGADGAVKLWDINSGRLIRTLDAGDIFGVHSLAFSPKAMSLFTGDMSGYSQWNVSSNFKFFTRASEGRDVVFSMAFASNETAVALGTSSGAKLIGSLSGSSRLLPGYTLAISSVALSPDSRALAGGDFEGRIRLWDPVGGVLVMTYEGHVGGIHALAFSPDGASLFSAGADGTVRQWEAWGGRRPIRTYLGHKVAARSVAVSPDGSVVASGGADGSLRTWDTKSGSPLRIVDAHGKGAVTVTFTAGGQALISGGIGGAIKIWETDTWRLMRTISGAQTSIRSFAISADERFVAAVTQEGAVRLWSVATGQLVQSFQLSQNGGPVALSPDGGIVAVIHDHGEITMTQTTGRRWRTIPHGHSSKPTSIAFARDGQTLRSRAIVDHQQAADERFWDASSGELLSAPRGDYAKEELESIATQRLRLRRHGAALRIDESDGLSFRPYRRIVILPEGHWVALAGDQKTYVGSPGAEAHLMLSEEFGSKTAPIGDEAAKRRRDSLN
ncbi:MAG: protein kinase domain-containing protein [Hyphomicrobiaceae bacterium]